MSDLTRNELEKISDEQLMNLILKQAITPTPTSRL